MIRHPLTHYCPRSQVEIRLFVSVDIRWALGTKSVLGARCPSCATVTPLYDCTNGLPYAFVAMDAYIVGLRGAKWATGDNGRLFLLPRFAVSWYAAKEREGFEGCMSRRLSTMSCDTNACFYDYQDCRSRRLLACRR